MAAAAAAADSTTSNAAHPALTRPAILTHVFKFVARNHADGVRLLHVHTAWEDAAVNYAPWLWERLALLSKDETTSR